MALTDGREFLTSQILFGKFRYFRKVFFRDFAKIKPGEIGKSLWRLLKVENF